MISGPVGFEEIVEAVKDGTGLVNIRPFYERIRRFIFRAEREIGYGGSIVLKRCKYKKDVNFNGTYIKYPDDFIEFEGVGTSGYGKFPSGAFIHGVDGIRFKSLQADVNFLYWGLQCDGRGNPITTRNHEEAVIAYIIWKLYSAKRFTDQGNANTLRDYEDDFTSLCLKSRGDDAFPTIEEMDDLARVMYSDRRELIQHPTASYSYCDDILMHECCGGGGDNPDPENNEFVYFWQVDNVIDQIGDIVPLIDQPYIDALARQPLSRFNEGFTVAYSNIGRICFLIQETAATEWEIRDVLGNIITDQFETQQLIGLKAILFVSKSFYTHSTIFFKFKKLL